MRKKILYTLLLSIFLCLFSLLGIVRVYACTCGEGRQTKAIHPVCLQGYNGLWSTRRFEKLTREQQPTVAFCERVNHYVTEEDYVSYDADLQGFYHWHFWIDSPQVTSGAISFLSQHSSDTLVSMQPDLTSIEMEDSLNRYTWALPEIGRGHPCHVYSSLEVEFRPGFDSQRTVDPTVLENEFTDQTLSVKVTLRENFLVLFVSLPPEEAEEIAFTVLADTAQPKLHAREWKIEDPEKDKEYTFSVHLRVENKLYPTKVTYNPSVMVGVIYEVYSSEDHVEGSSTTIEDDVLGSISYSVTTSRRWVRTQFLYRSVRYFSRIESLVEDLFTPAVVAAAGGAAVGVGVAMSTPKVSLPQEIPILESLVKSEIEEQIKGVKCRWCRRIAKRGSKYCPYCGSSLKGNRTCAGCKSIVPLNVRFCPKCGMRIGGGE